MLRLKSNLEVAPSTVSHVPLIDILFLLLLFFIINSQLYQPGIEVTLPTTQNHTFYPSNKMVLVISSKIHPETGEVVMYFNDKETTLSQFERVFRDEIRRQKIISGRYQGLDKSQKPALIIKADTTTSHGVMSRVRSIALEWGVTTIDQMGRGK